MKRQRPQDTHKEESKAQFREKRIMKTHTKDDSLLTNYISNPKTLTILKAKGIKYLFPIQHGVYDDVYKGVDILARDRTGSGKTLAYSLPIIQRFRNMNMFTKSSGIKMIVVLPTRQLAIQVAQEIESLKHQNMEYFVALAYGGTSVNEQKNLITAGCDILVATPGRLLDFIEKGVVKTRNVCLVCLDQADQMLKMGFKQQVDKILTLIKSQATSYKIQTLLFSATLPNWVIDLSKTYLCPNYRMVNMIDVKENSCSTTISHYKYETSKKRRIQAIRTLISHFVEKEGRCLIFCETKKQTAAIQDELSLSLKQSLRALHGDIPQQQRTRTYEAFKSGNVRFVVATNVAARGLDIPNVELVIQCSPPNNVESYIHRAGRTGRAGNTGTCVVLYTEDEQRFITKISNEARIEMKNFDGKQRHPPAKQTLTNMNSGTSNLRQKFIPNKPTNKIIQNNLIKYKISPYKNQNVDKSILINCLHKTIKFCEVQIVQAYKSERDDKNYVQFEIPCKYEDDMCELVGEFKKQGYFVMQSFDPKPQRGSKLAG